MPAIQMLSHSRRQATPSLDYWPISLAAGPARPRAMIMYRCEAYLAAKTPQKLTRVTRVYHTVSNVWATYDVAERHVAQKNHARKLAQRSGCIVKLEFISITLNRHWNLHTQNTSIMKQYLSLYPLSCHPQPYHCIIYHDRHVGSYEVTTTKDTAYTSLAKYRTDPLKRHRFKLVFPIIQSHFSIFQLFGTCTLPWLRRFVWIITVITIINNKDKFYVP